jgi:glycosyltransferase
MNKISIITATYNAAATLQHSLDSLAKQTASYEHIVVDGGSTDGTLEIIAEQGERVSRFITEPDQGLYDALNKGFRMATGDVVGILHADDFFAATNTLQLVADLFQDPAVDACYGDLLYVSEEAGAQFTTKRYWKSGDFDCRKFYWGWMPPHPTFFVRKSVYEKFGLFSLELGTAADYELMLRLLLKHQISCRYIPEVLVNMRIGGMSNASLGNRVKANRNDRKAWEVNGLKPYPWTLWMKPLRKLPQWWRRP